MTTSRTGYCECGCGQRTALATANDSRRGNVKGQPQRFVLGHTRRAGRRKPSEEGRLCECGCGERAPLAKRTHAALGLVRGQPQRFVHGHRNRKNPACREEDRGHETPCWIWLGAINDMGYGQFRRDGRGIYAHRASFERRFGPIPDGLELDHLCRVPACMNPDHLEPVSHVTNVRRGASARLTAADVSVIRAAKETNKDIAKRFGVTAPHVSRIRRGLAWREPACLACGDLAVPDHSAHEPTCQRCSEPA